MWVTFTDISIRGIAARACAACYVLGYRSTLTDDPRNSRPTNVDELVTCDAAAIPARQVAEQMCSTSTCDRLCGRELRVGF